MKIACVQANVVFGDPIANAQRAVREIGRLAEAGVEVAVFPEAFLTGYCVDSLEAATGIALHRSSAVFEELQQACDESEMLAVVGFAETDGECLYNAATLIEPGEERRFYRKTHLPELGYDRFATPGAELSVYDTRVGSIGVLICYDMRPPEATRVLALAGADLVILPTNWPEGAEISADIVSVARAAENKVFFAACNRVGTENGFTFIGRSKIVDVSGRILASGGGQEETLMADIELERARNKRTVVIPGKYELALFDCRRPELYGEITEAH